jgi:D-tyrosyl-tRNA(Tyr) deacylase
MIALLQRVTEARVIVDGRVVGEIGPGVLALACAERGDTPATATRLVARILAFRLFEDAAGKMNLSLGDTGGGLLLVPQFTLAADTRRGNRPSLALAAEPALGRSLFDHAVGEARSRHAPVATGEFGAHMRVSLVNDGPVTFWLRVDPPA